MSELKPCPIRHKTYEIKKNFKDRSLEETQAVASEIFTDLLTVLNQRDKLRQEVKQLKEDCILIEDGLTQKEKECEKLRSDLEKAVNLLKEAYIPDASLSDSYYDGVARQDLVEDLIHYTRLIKQTLAELETKNE